MTFLSSEESVIENDESLARHSFVVQEYLIMEDLLYVLIGIEGNYVKFKREGEGIVFEVDNGLDGTLFQMVERMLCMCEWYLFLKRFCDEHAKFEYGFVQHAFCHCVREILQDYLTLIAQLEYQFNRNELTLQRFWFYVQPMQSKMKGIYSLAMSIEKSNCKGGSLLSLIYDTYICYSGDEKIKEMYCNILRVTSEPYYEMIFVWMSKGEIRDPYEEFMIKEQPEYSKEDLKEDFNDGFWTSRFVFVNDRTPTFLEKYQKEILQGGKCVNVMKEFKKNFKKMKFQDFNKNKISEMNIEANESLVNFLKEKKLKSHILSLKQFFLLERGDFLTHFMDISSDELAKKNREMSMTKLQSLLELSLKSGTSAFNENHECVKCDFSIMSLYEQLKRIISVNENGMIERMRNELNGFESFILDYQVEFPVSLIVSKKVLTKYQIIFRHLFNCKHIERLLSETFSELKPYSIPLGDSIRQKMLNFIENIQYYSYFEVIEPNWNYFINKLESAKLVDEILKIHSDFLDTCLKECMLSNEKLLLIFEKMINLCHLFCSSVFQMTSNQINLNEFNLQLSQLDQNFTLEAKKLVESLNYFAAADYEHHMSNFICFLFIVNLVCRLDYNFHYSNKEIN
ncbi:hypothetical protein ROZALSC1DRAFT_16048 [Rozella allomycis CSF55]|uniref:Spindle pole body component n=1 Tax=Rozella allomycis (strain CSF55) TaxID=988480 RepID=A0A4P9YE68_ROZAC|nr:hypothetical protein ROZALSC1DRAFT_16048 [Rozella allomycis CSF55]